MSVYVSSVYFILYSQVQFAWTQVTDAVVFYNDTQVWQTKLSSTKDIALITKLEENGDISTWRLTSTSVDFLVHANNKKKVRHQLKGQRLTYSVIIDDVQRLLDEQRGGPAVWSEDALRNGHRLNWQSYADLTIIDEYLDALQRNYPSICKISVIGHTYENRPIKMVTISNGNPKNKAILMISGTHSREWTAVASILYVLDNIVTKYDRQPTYMKKNNWLIIPVLNPDGYQYSHTTDRLWRKNRRLIDSCTGVDINRNFETDWDIAGVSIKFDTCKQNYGGSHPFSEAESIAVRDVVLKMKGNLNALLDIHAYGELILFPWSTRSAPTKDEVLHKILGMGMSDAIYKETKKRFGFGAIRHVLYRASGTAIDWIYSSGVTRAIGIETRDKGQYGFALPPNQISEAGKELLAAVRHLAKEISPVLFVRGQDIQTWF